MRLAIGIGLATLGSASYLTLRRPILCEQLAIKSPIGQQQISRGLPSSSRYVDSQGVKRFGGRVDYHQLALGSFTGMVTGWMVGKLSRVLVTLLAGSFLTLEYLQHSGSIDISPWANSIYRWGVSKLNTEVVVKDPSFKVSFFSAFLIAAANS